MAGSLSSAKATTESKLASAKKAFEAKVNIVTNAITANDKKYEEKLEEVTGVVFDFKTASAEDRERIRDSIEAMDKDMNKAIARAIQLGEAKQAEVEKKA